jgi:DNA-binding NtrC family response regulator
MREERLSLLLDVGTMVRREVGLDVLLEEMGRRVAHSVDAERATIFLLDAATGGLRSRVAELPELPEIRLQAGQGIAGQVARSGQAINVADATQDARWYPAIDKATGYTTRNLLAVPICDSQRATRGVLQVINKRSGPFSDDDESFILALAAQIALAFEATTLRPDGAPRGIWVRGPYNHVVGNSPAMREVYSLLEKAAPSEATVLITGETGTGKGLLARTIHANSPRAAQPFTVVDCTTLPTTLVESELFGHERGAFTGAERRNPGRIEAAQGGTLFLDEIGELDVALQAKLLRLIQDRVFERVGGRELHQADVRVLVATHRDLARMVEQGSFRQDLYYRIRVLELCMPALRERGEAEVDALAMHFLGLYARRHGKRELGFDEAATLALRRHPWPGNVRELEHAVERGVILAEGKTIEPCHLGLPVRPPRGASSTGRTEGVVLPHGLTLDAATARYARATVEACDGNHSLAAKRLGIGRNTLARKMRE